MDSCFSCLDRYVTYIKIDHFKILAVSTYVVYICWCVCVCVFLASFIFILVVFGNKIIGWFIFLL